MRRAIRRCAASMCIVAMLSACAPTVDKWNNEGATAEARDSVFASCRSAAHARAASAPPASTYQQVPAAGGVIGILAGALVLAVVHSAAKGAAANASIDSCMRAAGYTAPQPAVNADGYRKDASAPDANVGDGRAHVRQPAITNTSTNTDCGEAARSPGPQSSLLAYQPPVSCTSARPVPPKAGHAP